MAGELVPLVLVPRYTTLAGNTDFTTIGMDVTEYQNAIISVWRGDLVGTAYNLRFQESTDQVNWTVCASTGDPIAVGAGEASYTAPLSKRWFRVKIQLTGTDPICSSWIVGFLEERIS